MFKDSSPTYCVLFSAIDVKYIVSSLNPIVGGHLQELNLLTETVGIEVKLATFM